MTNTPCYIEAAFRRGYQMAAAEALASVKANATPSDFAFWVQAVSEWREAGGDVDGAPIVKVTRRVVDEAAECA